MGQLWSIPIPVLRNLYYLCCTVLLFQQMSEINKNQGLWCRNFLSCLKKTCLLPCLDCMICNKLTMILPLLVSPPILSHKISTNLLFVLLSFIHLSCSLMWKTTPFPHLPWLSFPSNLCPSIHNNILVVQAVAQNCESYVSACGALASPACFPSCVHLCT